MLSFWKRHNERLGIWMGAITLIGLGFLTQRMLDVDRQCLSFAGVMELRFDGAVDPIRTCQQQSRLISPFISADHRKTLDVINQLGPIEDLLPKSLRGVSVTITASDPFFLIVSERSLVIGSELARTPAFLQRAVINAIASQVLSGQGTQKKDLASDLLWSFFDSEDVTLDPTTLEPVHTADWVALSQTPKTAMDYCAHPLRRLEDLSFCRFELNKEQEISYWIRYRPLIAWSVAKFLREEGLGATTHALRQLFGTLGEPVVEGTNPSAPEIWVRERVSEWLMTMDVRVNDETLDALWAQNKVDARGQFDFVVNVDSAQLGDQAVSSLLEWQEQSFVGRNSKVLVLMPGGQVELPLLRRTHYDLNQVTSNTHLVLGCQLPSVREVASLNTINLLAIKVCQAEELPRWAEILKEGQLNKNALMKFEMHGPSVQRWGKHHNAILAGNAPLDSVFCDPKTISGYPFKAYGCAQTPSFSQKN